MKGTRAWKGEFRLRGYSWVAFRSEILFFPLTDPIAIQYRNILKVATKEAAFTFQDVLTAIDFYVNRCSSTLHHAELDQLTRDADFNELALPVDSDFKELNSTPRAQQSAIVPLKSYQGYMVRNLQEYY